MDCPRCKKTEVSVIDSRDADSETIRRRRECDGCQYRFTTYERIEPLKLVVIKRDGSCEPYQREKILRGIELATEKRPIASNELEALADRIEMKLLADGEERVPSKKIGDYVIRELRRLDSVAYLRFASVYRSFASLEAFEAELARIKPKNEERRTHVPHR